VKGDSHGKVVTSTAQVITGDPLAITVTDGIIPATASSGAKLPTIRKKHQTPQPRLMEHLL
jgi:hypothetical protein